MFARNRSKARLRGRCLRLETLEERRPLATLDLQVWADLNSNGIREAIETSGVDSVVVEVWDAKDLDIGDDNDEQVGQFVSKSGEAIKLEDLPESHYYLRTRHPVGFGFSRAPSEPKEEDFVTAIDPGTGQSSLIYLAENDDKTLGIAVRGSAPTFGMGLAAGSKDGVIGSSLVDIANSVAVSPDGNLVVVGSFVGLADFDSGNIAVTSRSVGLADAFVAKYTPAGTLIWVQTFGGTGQDEFRNVSVGADGSVVAVGAFSKRVIVKEGLELLSVGSTDVFITKLSADGEVQWAHGIGASSGDVANSVAISTNVHVTIGGRFRLTVDFDPSSATESHTSSGGSDAFVSRFNSNGSHQWTRTFGGVGSSDEVLTISEDSKSRLVVSGRFSNSVDFDWSANENTITAVGKTDVFVMQVSSDLDVNWVTAFQGSDHVQNAFIQVDNSDEIIAAGGFRGAVDFALGDDNEVLTSAGSVDIYLARLGTDGKLKWAKRAGGEGSDQPLAVTLDQSGNIVLTGYLTKVADLDPGPGQWLVNPKDQPGFVVKLDTGGDFLYAASIGGIGNGIVAHDQNDVVVVGNFVGSPEFATNYRLVSAGGSDIFVVRYEANNPPVAYTQSATVLEDIAHKIQLTGDDGGDSEEQRIVFEVRTLPQRGSLHLDKDAAALKSDDLPYRLAADSVYFKTAKDDVAADSFTFQVVDDGGIANGGSNTSDPAKVDIEVTPVNDEPIAHDIEVATLDGVRLGIQLSAEDGDPEVTQRLTYYVDSLPDKGRLFTDPNRVFTTNDLPIQLSSSTVYFENQAGLLELQSFEFHVSDDGGTENGGVDVGEKATVSIVVRKNDNAPVNQQPSANDNEITVLEDATTTLALTADDGDASLAQRLTYYIRTLPANGTLRPGLAENPITPGQLPFALESSRVVYQTDLNDSEDTAFEFYVKDDGGTQNGGKDTSDPATISIAVTPVNDPPIAESFNVEVPEERKTLIELVGEDGDPEVDQQLTFIVSALPAAGVVQDADGTVITEDDLPFVLAGPEFFFTNAVGDLSDQQVEFYIQDDGGTENGGKNLSDREVGTLSIVHVNQAPTAEQIEVSTLEDTELTVTLRGDDGEDDLDQSLVFFIASLPAKGTLKKPGAEGVLINDDLPVRLVGNQIRFMPAADNVETQAFRYFVQDDGGTRFDGVDTSELAEVTVDVIPVNDPPFVDSVPIELIEDIETYVDFGLSDGDAEAEQNVTLTLLEIPSKVEVRETENSELITLGDLPLTLSGTSLLFTGKVDNEDQSIVLRAEDDGGTENGGIELGQNTRILIKVIPVNDQPIALAQTVDVLEDHSIDIRLEGDDGDEELDQQLTFEVLEQPEYGSIFINALEVIQYPVEVPAGELTYRPDENSVAQDKIKFRVQDDGGTDGGTGTGSDTSEQAEVVINVTPVNDPPVADSVQIAVVEDVRKLIELTGADGDEDAEQALTFIIESLPASGDLRSDPNADPLTDNDLPYVLSAMSVHYSPPHQSHEPTVFQYSVMDDGGTENGGIDESDAATVEITIVPQNDPPIANPQSLTIKEDDSIQLVLTADDGDPEVDQQLTYFVASLPSHGSLSEPGQSPIEEVALPLELSDPQLVFVPGKDEVSLASFTFFVRDDGDSENGLNQSEEASIAVDIEPVNDRPVLQAPAELSMAVSNTISLNIELSDVDVGNETIRLNVSVSGGAITVGSVQDGVSVDQVSYHQDGLVIEAPLKEVTTTIANNGLEFTAPDNDEGLLTIDLLLNDLGNTGEGGSLTAEKAIEVTVSNDDPWTNSRNPLDVNNDGRVSPVDTLLIVNWLNAGGIGSEPTKFTAPYYDTSADGAISALDALLVINHLNQPLTNDEGEDAATVLIPRIAESKSEEDEREEGSRWLSQLNEVTWDAVWQSYESPWRA